MLADNISKDSARSILKEGNLGLTYAQAAKVLKYLGSGKMDGITIKLMQDGEVRLCCMRAGAADGYQRMIFGIDQSGNTNRVVQTAFDDSNILVHQAPGESKNNLYDVKKWNV